ncbi:hypothetical protein K6025_02825 [Ehrlichia sp. JZT12]
MTDSRRSYTGRDLVMHARNYLEKKYMSQVLIEERFYIYSSCTIQKMCLTSGVKSQIEFDHDGCQRIMHIITNRIQC